MQVYIPESELKSADNIQRIYDIMDKVSDSDLKFLNHREEGEITLDEAVQKIRELGEDKIADFIWNHPLW